MAFDPCALRVLAPVMERYTGGPVLYSYTTDDPWDHVVERDYFLPAAANFRIGDVIFVNAETCGRTMSGIVVVMGKVGGAPVVGELVAPVAIGVREECV
jgi:hypothetical protein